jgi:serine phosphatase RsbU (regulator of sigma subunit)
MDAWWRNMNRRSNLARFASICKLRWSSSVVDKIRRWGESGPMMGFRPLPHRSISLAALGALLLLALTGLAERWTGPDLPFRLRHLSPIPHQEASTTSMTPLRPGDRLLAIEGVMLRRDPSATGRLVAAARRGPVLISFEREGQFFEDLFHARPPTLERRFGWLLRTLAALLIFLTGFWVYRRRQDPLSRLFFILTLLMGSLFTLDPRLAPGLPARLLELKGDLFGLFLPSVWLHFLILFPERRSRPLWLRALIYAPPIILALPTSVALLQDISLFGGPEFAIQLQSVAGVVSALFLLIGLVVLAVKASRRKRRREQRRIRLVLLASLLGILPLSAFSILHQLLPGQRLGLAAWTPLLLTLLPLSFAHGILGPDLPALNRRARHLRRIIQTGALLTLVFLAARLALHGLRGARGAVEDLFLDAVALTVALILLPTLRKRLFHRPGDREENPYRETQKWLAPPRYFTSRRELGRALIPRIGWDARASWVLWLELEEQGVWAVRDRWQREGGPAQSITVPPAGSAFSLPTGLETALRGQRAFLAAEQWDPYWASSMLGADALPYCKERDWALLLCLARESEQPALIVFGPTIEGALYDANSIEGLGSLMSPLELHLRNLALVRTAARQEQLRSEMELARSIQMSLLPRETPDLAGIELACRIQTSSEVGGDYYDFLELDRGKLGLALGDATGHGVPAALLISTVASAFHTQAAGGQNPGGVIEAMNRSLFHLVSDRSLQRGAFAGFVYALFDREASLLHYCNGGMPSPWLLRADGRIERLHRGGHLLGFAEHHHYQEGVLRLSAGDLLFFRSDGVEDIENGNGEEFGEQRLLDWLQKRQELDLEGLSDQLLASLKTYSSGELNDDISFMFMRLGDISQY